MLLRNADAIIAPLATLARANQTASASAASGSPPDARRSPTSPPSQPAPQAQPAGPDATAATWDAAAAALARAAAPALAGAAGAVPTNAHPSFDCRKARTKGERAVCSDAGLAALDRNMSAQYVRAISGASPEQHAQLRRPGIASSLIAIAVRTVHAWEIAYVGRMREIRDIMEGTGTRVENWWSLFGCSLLATT